MKQRRIILITGGQRSGKSAYAEQKALSLSSSPLYVATSRIWDDEHRARIRKHQERRSKAWTTIEEEKYLHEINAENQVVLIDCVTLWATNFFFDLKADTDQSLSELKQEFDAFIDQNATFIFVTNELGMGEMSMNATQRKFADLQGWINQYIAQKADEVYLMVCGIPQKIK